MEKTGCPKLNRLTIIGSAINSLPEYCNVDKITFEYVNRGIEEKNLFQKLKNDFTKEIDFSIFTEDDFNSLYNVLYNVSGGLEGMEAKLGIEKSGQRLLVAYFFEAIQRKLWE